MSLIVPLYKLSIVSLYRRQYTFPIRIAYKINYKEPLYFDIPDVIGAQAHSGCSDAARPRVGGTSSK